MDHLAYKSTIYMVLMVIVMVSAIIDYQQHRIPNWLAFSGWYLGPLLHLYFAGVPAFSEALIGLSMVLALTFPFFMLSWMGAGDVKLMTSIGALVGGHHALFFLVSIVFAGFALGVIQLVFKGLLPTYVRRYSAMIGLSFVFSRPVYVAPDDKQQAVVMPYAVSIAVGSLVAMILI